MARIICLANSYRKKGGRCVAGIDIETGKWVRPVVGKSASGEDIPIPVSLAKINGQEIRPLELVELPLVGGYRAGEDSGDGEADFEEARVSAGSAG